MLDTNELSLFEAKLRNVLDERSEEILVKLNRDEKLTELVKLLGIPELLGDVMGDERHRDGKIVVIGQTSTNVDILIGVAKNFGFQKDRFEFYLDYNDPKRFDNRKMQYSPNYSCILVGPMPHSGIQKGEYSSIIAALMEEEGYPPVCKMGQDELKITKSSFRRTLEELISKGIIAE